LKEAPCALKTPAGNQPPWARETTTPLPYYRQGQAAALSALPNLDGGKRRDAWLGTGGLCFLAAVQVC
jgi:hypothetical protein